MAENEFTNEANDPIRKPPASGVMTSELPQEREIRETPLPEGYTPGGLMSGENDLDRDFPVK